MNWSPLPFGKYKGQTLPQVICSDPSWFLWAIRKGVFKYQHASEGDVLYRRTKAIKIPKRHPEKFALEHRYDGDGRYEGFYIVQKAELPYSKYNVRSPHLDITEVNARHQREWHNFIRDFRKHYFGGKYITEIRCDQFFRDDSNFLDP